MINPSTAKRLAKRRGVVRYHGKPCKKCSNTEHYTANSSCVHCNLAAVKKRYVALKVKHDTT